MIKGVIWPNMLGYSGLIILHELGICKRAWINACKTADVFHCRVLPNSKLESSGSVCKRLRAQRGQFPTNFGRWTIFSRLRQDPWATSLLGKNRLRWKLNEFMGTLRRCSQWGDRGERFGARDQWLPHGTSGPSWIPEEESKELPSVWECPEVENQQMFDGKNQGFLHAFP